MSRYYQELRSRTGLSDAEIRRLGESINIRDISNDGEVDRVLAEYERTNVKGNPDLYGQVRNETGLSNDAIRELALSLGIRDLDKDREVTRVLEAYNSANPETPEPETEPTPTSTSTGVSQSDYDTLLSDYQNLQATYGANITNAVNTATSGYEDRIRRMNDDFTRQLDDYRGEMEANTQRFQQQYQGALVPG